MPAALTWLVRVVVVILAAAAVAAGVVGPGGSAGRLWLAAAAAAVSLAALATAELVQLRLIRGARLGSSTAALAFDDALLSETVVDIAKLWFGWLGFLVLTPATSWPLRRLLRRDPPPAGINELSTRTGYGYTWW